MPLLQEWHADKDMFAQAFIEKVQCTVLEWFTNRFRLTCNWRRVYRSSASRLLGEDLHETADEAPEQAEEEALAAVQEFTEEATLEAHIVPPGEDEPAAASIAPGVEPSSQPSIPAAGRPLVASVAAGASAVPQFRVQFDVEGNTAAEDYYLWLRNIVQKQAPHLGRLKDLVGALMEAQAVEVHLAEFGSRRYMLALPDSDTDLVVTPSPSGHSAVELFRRVADHLRVVLQSGMGTLQVKEAPWKMTIELQYRHLCCDIMFSPKGASERAVQQTEAMRRCIADLTFEQQHATVLLVDWAKAHGCAWTKGGKLALSKTLKGIHWACLCLGACRYLQVCPSPQPENTGGWVSYFAAFIASFPFEAWAMDPCCTLNEGPFVHRTDAKLAQWRSKEAVCIGPCGGNWLNIQPVKEPLQRLAAAGREVWEELRKQRETDWQHHIQVMDMPPPPLPSMPKPVQSEPHCAVLPVPFLTSCGASSTAPPALPTALAAAAAAPPPPPQPAPPSVTHVGAVATVAAAPPPAPPFPQPAAPIHSEALAAASLPQGLEPPPDMPYHAAPPPAPPLQQPTPSIHSEARPATPYHSGAVAVAAAALPGSAMPVWTSGATHTWQVAGAPAGQFQVFFPVGHDVSQLPWLLFCPGSDGSSPRSLGRKAAEKYQAGARFFDHFAMIIPVTCGNWKSPPQFWLLDLCARIRDHYKTTMSLMGFSKGAWLCAYLCQHHYPHQQQHYPAPTPALPAPTQRVACPPNQHYQHTTN